MSWKETDQKGGLSRPIGESQILWGTEIGRMATSVEEAAYIPQESTPELKVRGQALVGAFGHAVGAIGIPYLSDATTVPAGTRSARLTVSRVVQRRVGSPLRLCALASRCSPARPWLLPGHSAAGSTSTLCTTSHSTRLSEWPSLPTRLRPGF